jgi:RND family efflux transporter MFP subunit
MRQILMQLLTIPALALLVMGCGKPEQASAPARPVRTMIIESGSAFTGRVFPGRAEAVQAVDIAFEVQGQLSERAVKVGDEVTKGQALAKLDPRDYANDMESAKAKLDRANAYLDRIKKAAATGAVAEQDLTDAQAQFDIADANLKVKTKALADTHIVAPFDGTVSATYVENHQNVQAKEPVLRLIDLTEIELKIDVPEALIAYAKHLQDVTVTFDAHPDAPVPAEVKEIGSEASTTTRTYPVTLVMTQPGTFVLLPGMTGQARGRPGNLGDTPEGVRQVSASAVFEEAGKHFVWIVDDTALTVKKRAVEPYDINAGGMLVQGLEPGQRVVTAGAHHLSDGQAIRLLDNAPTQTDV